MGTDLQLPVNNSLLTFVEITHKSISLAWMAHYQNYLYKNVQRESKLLCYFHVLTSIQWLILKIEATLPKKDNLVSTAVSQFTS